MSKKFTLILNGDIVAAFNNGNRLRYAMDLAMREAGSYGYDGEISDAFLIDFLLERSHTIKNIHSGFSTLTLEIGD